MGKPKIFVLDTNILISTSGEAITGFDDNDVVITTTTLEELDGLKKKSYEAREAVRKIYALSDYGKNDLHLGVELPGGGIFSIEPNGQDQRLLPAGMSLDKADNRILSSALSIKHKHADRQTILVTNDILMLVKATSAGMKAQTYKNSEIASDEIYAGYETIWLRKDEIDELYKANSIKFDIPEELTLYENEYLIIKSYEGTGSALGIYKNGVITRLPETLQAYGITSRNAKQAFALHALLSDDIPMVILQGIAGSGKTLLATASGMEGVFTQDRYDSMLYTRNNILFDEDIGFLPGDEQQKMSALTRPLMDNLKRLMAIKGSEPGMIMDQIHDFIRTGLINIESMAFMRGRSIYNSFVIIDEAQNASPRQIRGICTRPAEKTKIVLLGDPSQVDSPYLSQRNNGLVFASERMKGSKCCAQVAFLNGNECERGELVRDAAERLIIDSV